MHSCAPELRIQNQKRAFSSQRFCSVQMRKRRAAHTAVRNFCSPTTTGSQRRKPSGSAKRISSSGRATNRRGRCTARLPGSVSATEKRKRGVRAAPEESGARSAHSTACRRTPRRAGRCGAGGHGAAQSHPRGTAARRGLCKRPFIFSVPQHRQRRDGSHGQSLPPHCAVAPGRRVSPQTSPGWNGTHPRGSPEDVPRCSRDRHPLSPPRPGTRRPRPLTAPHGPAALRLTEGARPPPHLLPRLVQPPQPLLQLPPVAPRRLDALPSLLQQEPRLGLGLHGQPRRRAGPRKDPTSAGRGGKRGGAGRGGAATVGAVSRGGRCLAGLCRDVTRPPLRAPRRQNPHRGSGSGSLGT